MNLDRAVELSQLKAEVMGFRLAAAELLVRAQAREEELADKEDAYRAEAEAERQLDRPPGTKRSRSGVAYRPYPRHTEEDDERDRG